MKEDLEGERGGEDLQGGKIGEKGGTDLSGGKGRKDLRGEEWEKGEKILRGDFQGERSNGLVPMAIWVNSKGTQIRKQACNVGGRRRRYKIYLLCPF